MHAVRLSASTSTTTPTTACATCIAQIREQGTRRDYARRCQARPRRHPRDRVHRAGAAARPRRARAARCAYAARCRRSPRSPTRGLLPAAAGASCATPTSSCATSSTGCSTATTRRRRRCPPMPPSARRSRAGDGLRRRDAVRRARSAAHRGARRASTSTSCFGRSRASAATADAAPCVRASVAIGQPAPATPRRVLAQAGFADPAALLDDARAACARAARYAAVAGAVARSASTRWCRSCSRRPRTRRRPRRCADRLRCGCSRCSKRSAGAAPTSRC